MKHFNKPATYLALLAVAALGTWAFASPARADSEDREESQVRRGLQIAPVPLNLNGRNIRLVGMGSYIVNAASGCNDCHSQGPATQYLPGGNPYFGQHPARQDPSKYLGGGRNFGALIPNSPEIVSRNLTPDGKGRILGGDSFEKFVHTLRTGIDPDKVHPSCAPGVAGPCLPPPFDGELLQVMPWAVIGQMKEQDLRAIYEYLGAIPCVEGGPAESADRCKP